MWQIYLLRRSTASNLAHNTVNSQTARSFQSVHGANIWKPEICQNWQYLDIRLIKDWPFNWHEVKEQIVFLKRQFACRMYCIVYQSLIKNCSILLT